MNMLGMSHALESFLSLDILIMLSIGSKFPKFWIQSFCLILRFWVRSKNGYWHWKVQDAPQISDTDSLEFEYLYWNPRLNYIPTDYNWRYLCFFLSFSVFIHFGEIRNLDLRPDHFFMNEWMNEWVSET